MNFNLPKEPVDKYRIDWWETYREEKVKHCHAVCYIDTPYREFDPDSNFGASITDDWMIFED